MGSGCGGIYKGLGNLETVYMRVKDKRIGVDGYARHKVGLEFVQIDIQAAVKA